MVDLKMNIYIVIMYTEMMHLAVRLVMTMTSITNIYEKMFSVAKTFLHLIFVLVLPQDTEFYCSSDELPQDGYRLKSPC